MVLLLFSLVLAVLLDTEGTFGVKGNYHKTPKVITFRRGPTASQVF